MSKFDHSEQTPEDKARKEAADEKAEKALRAKQSPQEKEAAEKAKAVKVGGKKAGKGEKKAAKPKAEKKAAKPKKEKAPKAKKAAKPKKETKRAYRRHEGTEEDPFTGQSAPRRKLEKEDLNDKEKAVLTAVNRAKEITLEALAGRTQPSNISAAKRNSWTRNALRRLVREKFVKKAGRGLYRAA